MSDAHFIGIDLGGSKIELVLCQNQALNVLERKRVGCEKQFGYRHLLEQIATLIMDARQKVGSVKAVTMGIPGSINPLTGLVRNCNVTCFNGKPLATDIEAIIQQPIQVFNDANCFALSEALLGAGKGYQSVLGIIIGTGLGGGIVENQRLRVGHQGYAAEIGHVSIDLDGYRCWCGNRGCIENYLSGSGIERIYYEQSQQQCKTPEIYQRFLASESAAIQTFEHYLRYFGRGIANLIYLYDPDIIVLGGGVSKLDILYSKGKQAIAQHFQQEMIEINLVANQLGDASGVYGAVLAGMNA